MNNNLISAAVAAALVPLASVAFGMSAEQAIDALELNELAATYSEEKIARVTTGESDSPADALLIDMGVISVEDLAKREILSAKLESFVADYQDASENYIGNVSDRNIVERVLRAYEQATVIQDQDVLDFLSGLIDKGYTTGYNVIDINDSSNFDPDLMLRYGHSDIRHAVQLLYLMGSEGFDPKVQFIPKSSAFVFLPEWGDPGPNVVTFGSGTMVSVVREYNIDFEFETMERKEAFMDLVDEFANKDAADEEGLIYGAWWQPFYRSYTDMAGYVPVSENRVTLGQYQAELLVLPEGAAQQADQIRSTGEGYDVETIDVWVNPDFYRYLNGEAN